MPTIHSKRTRRAPGAPSSKSKTKRSKSEAQPAKTAGTHWKPKAKALADKAKTKARDAALMKLSQERTLLNVTKNVTLGPANLGFTGTLKEKVALSQSDPLVTSNADRAAAKHLTWTQVSLAGAANAGMGLAPLPGIGASFGYSRGAQLSAIVPTDSQVTGKSLLQLPKDQVKALTLELHPDKVTDFAPGTEFSIAEQPMNLNVGVSASGAAALGPIATTVGVNAWGAAQKDSYTKNVVVAQDKHVKVRIRQQDSVSGGVTVGVTSGLDPTLLPRVPGGPAIQSAVTKAETLAANKTRITASLGANASAERSIAVAGNFDLKTDEGRKGYRYLMEVDPKDLETKPKDAQKLLEGMGIGAAYVETTVQTGLNASASVGTHSMLGFSTGMRTTQGALLEVKDNGKLIEQTKLSEKEYNRSVSGLLPRLANGEERQISVRLGSVLKNGVEDRAALVSVNVQDPKVTARESQQAANFAKAMGVSADQKPSRSNGKGTFAIQVGVPEHGIAALDTLSREQFNAAFEKAMSAIDGEPVPWKNETQSKRSEHYRSEKYFEPPAVKARFDEAKRAFDTIETFGDSDGKRADVLRDYRDTTGRDLEQDVKSYNAMLLLGEQVEKSRGKSVTDRGPLLTTIGKLSGNDVRTAMLTMHDVAGAGLVSLAYDANGVNVSAAPSAAPKSIGEVANEALNR